MIAVIGACLCSHAVASMSCECGAGTTQTRIPGMTTIAPAAFVSVGAARQTRKGVWGVEADGHPVTTARGQAWEASRRRLVTPERPPCSA